MKTQTAYVVDQQTRADNWENWQRTSWPVMASDKDNARTMARTAATLQGLHVGECYSVKEA
jgi:hypothetical protein